MTEIYKASVIVSTYERPDALRAVLAGLANQTRTDFEVIVVDDGSGICTKETVEESRAFFGDRLVHAWQADEGFRAAAARNLGVAQMRSAYAIFLDGDCVPRQGFVDGHLRDAAPKTLVRGSRVLLSKIITEKSLAEQDPIHRWNMIGIIRRRLLNEVNRVFPMLMPGPAIGRDSQPSHWRSVRSCNCALWRSDLLAMGGFDESYVGWGYEDSDLAIRAIALGLHVRRARSLTCVFHLWHNEKPRTSTGANWDRLLQVERERRTFALKTSLSSDTPKSQA
ncbi:MAG: glycosyltransferase [Planctomycetes bacterium]|nr:glycosyltransferase [Planctomycetota bacterium]